MWGDHGRDYLVAVIPIPAPPEVAGQLGWSRRDGFALYVTPTVDEPTLVHVITHEYMHSWFPDAFGHIAPEAFGAEAWFGEGFTDYYADRALLASGVWSLEDFAARYQTVIRDYWSSPAHAATGAQLALGFFRDRDLERMSYLRGALMAWAFDQRVRDATHGRQTLREVLLSAMSAQDGATPVARLRAAARRIGVDIAPDLEALASGADIDLPWSVFAGCIDLRTSRAASYERGFPPVSLVEPVGEVDPHGPAYAAGLRAGMIMVAREAGEPGDSRVEQVWRVRDRGGERLIHFFPRGQAMVTMRDVAVTRDLSPARRAACVREIVDSGGR